MPLPLLKHRHTRPLLAFWLVFLMGSFHVLMAQAATGGQSQANTVFLYPTAVSKGLQPYQASGEILGQSDTRMPLILVHGISPTHGDYYNWGLFLNEMTQVPEFNQRYQVYLFVYDPQQPQPVLSEAFRQTLAKLIEDKKATRIRILALSLGGLLARDALFDPALSPVLDQVITIGTPFHGTPLANPAWIRDQLKQESLLSPLRMTNRLVYHLVRKKFPNFESDYAWDNFDGSMPQQIKATKPCQRQKLDASLNSKLITYSSFFAAEQPALKALKQTLALDHHLSSPDHPHRRPPRITLGDRMTDKHAMMDLVRESMANLPLNQTAQDSQTPALMAFNDGVCPISSHLWLGRFIEQQAPEKASEKSSSTPSTSSAMSLSQNHLWDILKGLQKSQNARLFANLDHRDWMEGTTRNLNSNNQVTDLLHPNEPSKPVFEWLKDDLLR